MGQIMLLAGPCPYRMLCKPALVGQAQERRGAWGDFFCRLSGLNGPHLGGGPRAAGVLFHPGGGAVRVAGSG